MRTRRIAALTLAGLLALGASACEAGGEVETDIQDTGTETETETGFETETGTEMES